MRVHIVREAVFGGLLCTAARSNLSAIHSGAVGVDPDTLHSRATTARLFALTPHHSFRSKQWRVHLVSIRASVDANMGYPGSRDLDEGAALSKDEVRKEIQEFRMGNHP